MVHFADGIPNLPTYALVATAIIVGFFTLVRGRADVWKSNYEGEKERADNTQKDKEKLLQENIELKAENATLKSKPNVEGMAKMLADHDTNATKRNENIIKVLKAIAKKLD